ncbi:hypothetical protein ACN27F_12460 [Solwaraspora sp. WMMB335]|uniref:hypothetical protein n=1 Tax=Solwaraspora sp. WMMB335 TaxID=3404118 RepID=UPI003B93CC77
MDRMRKTLVAVTMGAVLAFTLGGCGADVEAESADQTAAEAGAAATTASADPAASAGADAQATAAACESAIALSEERAANLENDLAEMMAVAVEGAEGGDKAEAQFRAMLTEWEESLSSLAAEPVDEGVRQALLDGSEWVAQINDPQDNTPMGQLVDGAAKLADDIKAACA